MSSVVISYGFEPGVAQRLDPERRFYKELSPTLRADAGDNQAAWETEISVTLKAAMGESGSNTPYVLVEVDNDSSSLGQSSARQQSDDS